MRAFPAIQKKLEADARLAPVVQASGAKVE